MVCLQLLLLGHMLLLGSSSSIAVALMTYVFLKLLAVVAAAEIWKIEDFSK